MVSGDSFSGVILSEAKDLLFPPHESSIRLIEIEEGRTIGEKRNFGCERAAGEIIAHWDDDDFSAPDRLADQLTRLQSSGKSVTGYSSMYFARNPSLPQSRDRQGAVAYPLDWWLFHCSPTQVIGSSLFYRKSWWKEHPFPAKQVGEDSDFSRMAAQSNQLVSSKAGFLMIATVHEGNTSPRNLSGYKRVPDFPGIAGLEFPQ